MKILKRLSRPCKGAGFSSTGPFSQLVFMLGLTETLMMTIEQPDALKQALDW